METRREVLARSRRVKDLGQEACEMPGGRRLVLLGLIAAREEPARGD